MPRVTDPEVKGIFATANDTTPFIFTASMLVDILLLPYYTDASLLTQFELYLSAHLASARDPLIIERTLGDTRLRYQRSSESLGLQGSPYGQAVLLMDSLGILSPTTEEAGAAVQTASFDVL